MKLNKKQSHWSTQNILEARAKQLAQVPSENIIENQPVEFVTFHLGKEYWGISPAMAFETQPLKSLHWSKVPGAPPFITGVVNLRSHIYSIMNLVAFFGQPVSPISENAHILLLKGGICADGKEMELTLLSDDVPLIKIVQNKDIFPPSENISELMRNFLLGNTSELLSILDINRLLSDPRIIIQESEI